VIGEWTGGGDVIGSSVSRVPFASDPRG